MNKFDEIFNKIILEQIENSSEHVPNFDDMKLLLHFTVDDIKEIMKYDQKNLEYYKNELENLIYCIEGPWNTGEKTIEEMYKTSEAGHFTGTHKYLKRILDICKEHNDNLQLQHIYDKNIKVCQDFELYKNEWPKYKDMRFGCRCGHFGGLRKKSELFF